MGIDGIGKGGGVPPTSAPKTGDAGGVKPTTETGRTFDVRGTKAEHAEAAQKAAGAAPAAPLERLKAGEIDVNGYVDLKVEHATSHLKGLSRVELDHIRATLKKQMTEDPAILDLVKQATGAVPSTGDE